MDNTATDSTQFPPKDYVETDDLQDFGESPAHDAKTDALSKAQNFRDLAGERAVNFKEEAGERFKQGAEKARELHLTAEDYVRENPTKTVLGALGVGVIIGLILRR